ncbi:MAG: tRNA pseudouridine(38-40) synthase TruA [Candidatus Latescibacterota bacterium]|nr:tRNA pseudouridine(38-40) synthase TruA [Candidatus Latescibacterota bacterium]
MKTYRLDLEYDGTEFKGWQVQPNQRTVQGELEDCLAVLFGKPIRTTAAGRTDTGVHAFGQVASFETEDERDLYALRKSLNGMLPGDVVIKHASYEDAGFNARFSATSRVYIYDIAYAERAIGRSYAWLRRDRLCLPALRQAAGCIIGQHDFTSFCVSAEERESRICEVRSCEWEERENGIRLTISANRFIRAMVRSLVGTFVDVGRGFQDADDIPGILAAENRSAAGTTAPPHGLFLSSVEYGSS